MNRKALAVLSVGIVAVSMAAGFASGLLVSDGEPTTDAPEMNSTIEEMEANSPTPDGWCSLSIHVNPTEGESVILEESAQQWNESGMGVVDTAAFIDETEYVKSLMRGSEVRVYAVNLSDNSAALLNESYVTDDCTLINEGGE